MAAQNRWMYVSVGAETRLAVVQLMADGTMTAAPDRDLTLPGQPGAVTYARRTRRLYVGVRPGSVVTVALDADGRPSLAGSTDNTGFPVFLDTAVDESVLITAYFGAGELKTHSIAGDPPHASVTTLTTTVEPHQALVGPGGRVYVPHRNSDRVRWYEVAANGQMTYVDELTAPSGVGPRHVSFSPDGQRGYLINEYADSITVHSVGANGALSPTQTLPTLPEGVDGTDNTCADIHVLANGRFAYGTNRGHDSIAGYRIESDGSLVLLGTTPTEARPREFDISPDDRYLVAAGQDSGYLQSYRIEDDGSLTSIDRLQVGGDLRWVIID